jgi:hypothetical protein
MRPPAIQPWQRERIGYGDNDSNTDGSLVGVSA